MAERYPGDGAAANGFGRRSLQKWEARLLYEANYPAPLDFRGPPSWRLSVGGVYIPLPPVAAELDEEIQVTLAVMSDEERALPERFPDNHAAWATYFRERYERELASYEGPPPPPARNNVDGRRRRWSIPGRTLAVVLDHTQAGNSPVLQMPPRTQAFSRRHGNSWMPRRMESTSLSSGSASCSSGYAPPATPTTQLRAVKPEPVSPPCNRVRGGGIVIRERRGPSPPHGHDRLVCVKREPEEGGHAGGSLRKPKKEATPVTSPDTEDDTILEAVMARSLNDVVPVDVWMPMDVALAWSKVEWEREEAERQQRLLEEAARRRVRRVVVLDDSEDDGQWRSFKQILGRAKLTKSRVLATTPSVSK